MPAFKGYYKIFNLIIIFLLFTLYSLSGQDIHFSMFNNCPLYLNPANTGNFEGDWRIAGNYRDQWRTLDVSYSTFAFSFDKHFRIYHQNIEAGILFINDNSFLLSSNQVYFSLAYSRILKNNYITGGLQVGYANRSLESDKILFPDQYDHSTGTINPGLPTGESGYDENISYIDINFGFLWKRSIKSITPEIGFSFSHLNVPKVSFFGNKEILPIRLLGHTQIKIKLSDKYSVVPLFMYMRSKKAEEFNFGTRLDYSILGISSIKELSGGLYARNLFISNIDAITVMAGMKVRRIRVGLAYDINISNLRKGTNTFGALEFSVIYESISTVLNSYSIPCERY